MGAKKTLAAWVAKYVKNFTVEKVLASIFRPVGRRVSNSEAKSLGEMWSMPFARTGPEQLSFLSTTYSVVVALHKLKGLRVTPGLTILQPWKCTVSPLVEVISKLYVIFFVSGFWTSRLKSWKSPLWTIKGLPGIAPQTNVPVSMALCPSSFTTI